MFEMIKYFGSAHAKSSAVAERINFNESHQIVFIFHHDVTLERRKRPLSVDSNVGVLLRNMQRNIVVFLLRTLTAERGKVHRCKDKTGEDLKK